MVAHSASGPFCLLPARVLPGLIPLRRVFYDTLVLEHLPERSRASERGGVVGTHASSATNIAQLARVLTPPPLSSSPRPPSTHPPPRPIHGTQMGPRNTYHYVRPTAAAKAGVPPPSIEEGVPMEPPTFNPAPPATSEHANTTNDGRVGRSWRKWRQGKRNQATGTYLLPSSYALP